MTLPSGAIVRNPLRVPIHPDGCEVVFTLRQLGLTDEEFDRDCRMVADDLARLRQLLEGEHDGPALQQAPVGPS